MTTEETTETLPPVGGWSNPHNLFTASYVLWSALNEAGLHNTANSYCDTYSEFLEAHGLAGWDEDEEEELEIDPADWRPLGDEAEAVIRSTAGRAFFTECLSLASECRLEMADLRALVDAWKAYEAKA